MIFTPAVRGGFAATVVMIVCGAHKHAAYTRISRAESYEPDWPATVVVECKNPTLIADRAAFEGNL